MKMRMPLGRKESFTLVEMLVVMAIIGILVGLLMPTLGRARERGRNARCKGNLRNLQIAAMNYAYGSGGSLPHAISTEDYDITRTPTTKRWLLDDIGWVHWNFYNNTQTRGPPAYPSGYTRPGVTPWWGPWAVTSVVNGALWSYVGQSMKTFYCPTFVLPENCGTTCPDNLYPPFFVVRSYVMNSRASGQDLGNIQASRMVLFADGSATNWWTLTNGVPLSRRQISQRCLRDSQSAQPVATGKVAWDGALTGTKVTGAANPFPYEDIGQYHNGRGNVIFVDGHVEALPLPLSPPDVTTLDVRRDLTNACWGTKW